MYNLDNFYASANRMQAALIIAIAAMLALAAPSAFGQAAASSVARHLVMLSSPAPRSSSQVPAGEILREIDDPSNGDHWLLVHNADHPAGPGLLLLVSGIRIQARQAGPVEEPVVPVIRAGDRVIVEENTPLVEARLEAVAMSPAMAGSSFNARLNISGKVIRAVASGPGRAIFQEAATR
jgi:hypothetical protein